MQRKLTKHPKIVTIHLVQLLKYSNLHLFAYYLLSVHLFYGNNNIKVTNQCRLLILLLHTLHNFMYITFEGHTIDT